MRSPSRSLLGFVVLLGACSSNPGCPGQGKDTGRSGGGKKGDEGGDGRDVPKDAIEVAIDGRPGRSFVATLSDVRGATCPAAPAGWVLEPPLSAPSPSLETLLSRYCVYRLPKSSDTPASMPVLADPHGHVRSAVAEYAQVLTQAPARSLTQEFKLGTGDLDHAVLRERLGIVFKEDLPEPLGPKPTVAIIDTAAHDASWATAARADEHGLVMGGIVDLVRCPDTEPTCPGERVHYERAFDPELRGRASVMSLTSAILRAIEHWDDLGGDEPLVLNMSVGWEWDSGKNAALSDLRCRQLSPEKCEGPEPATTEWKPGQPTPSEEALMLALSYASCRGVLSVAAAGNTRSGACTEIGMMAPAAWEAFDPPTAAQCAELLDGDTPASLGNRLAYGVGGVDEDDRPIVNARPKSDPPRVLYASMAAVPTTGDDFSIPLTGTSVSTAAMSGLAAQYWTMHPGLTPNALMDDMLGSCQSVDAQCVAPGKSVPVVRGRSVLPGLYLRDQDLRIEAIVPPLPGPLTPESTALGPVGQLSCLGRNVTLYSTGGTTPTGATWPELTPQPNSPICTRCNLTDENASGASLKISVDPDYLQRTDGTKAVLELFLDSGQVDRFDLELKSGCSLDSCQVWLNGYAHPRGLSGFTLADYVVGASIDEATLSFYVQDGQGGHRLVGNEIDVF